MGWKRDVLDLAHRAGGLRATGSVFGAHSLRVLAYHRIAEVCDPAFDTFRGNVSASVTEFARQMAYVAEYYHPVGIDQVLAALDGRIRLPRRAVLVTFDDGYRDNFTTALPVLERQDIPALVFLATDHIGTGAGYWWDRIAWMFAHTDLIEADLPEAGHRAWTASTRDAIAGRYIEQLKTLPTHRKLDAVDGLGEALAVRVPANAFEGLALDWGEVRKMESSGVAFGAHTCSHPVLSRVPIGAARREIFDSRDRIREELGSAPATFAYPNGLEADFTPAVVDAVHDAGFAMAVTLVPGPVRRREVLESPLAVRRIYIHHGDRDARFAAKLAGVPRLVGSLR